MSGDFVVGFARSAAAVVEDLFFLAGGHADDGEAAISKSTDGETWVRQTFADFGNAANFSNGVFALARGAGIFVAGGSDDTLGPAVATGTADGTTWTRRTFAGFNGRINALAFGAGLFVAGGTNGSNAAIATSPDGITWTARTFTAFGEAEGAAVFGLTFGNSLFIAVGVNSDAQQAIATSPDGITWTVVTTVLTGGQLNSALTLSGPTFYAGGQDNTGSPLASLQTSTNHLTWTQQTVYATGANPIIRALIFAGGQYVAAGDDTTGTTSIFTSPTALAASWTPQTLTDFDVDYSSMLALLFGNNIYMAGGANSTDGASTFNAALFTSSDAETWGAVDAGFGSGEASVTSLIAGQ